MDGAAIGFLHVIIRCKLPQFSSFNKKKLVPYMCNLLDKYIIISYLISAQAMKSNLIGLRTQIQHA